jgi:hypothetical protein
MMSFFPKTRATANVLVFFFRLVPSFCLGNGLANIGLLEVWAELLYATPGHLWIHRDSIETSRSRFLLSARFPEVLSRALIRTVRL